ncbi:MAG: fatty acid desaturase [Synechococcaceae bacterium WB9_2_170]|nr:fatty acid desaturase [Synechococcaceae bacterium WB9_2_170]
MGLGFPLAPVAVVAAPTVRSNLLPRPVLLELNRVRNRPGLIRLASHLLTIAVGGVVWAHPQLPLLVRLLGLLVSGIGLATAFAPMHECGHRTVFTSRRLNDAVAWMAGLLSFYNATFYRRYHQWHHRYAHQPGLDPELEDVPPSSLLAYALEISGWNWWIGKLRGHGRLLFGDLSVYPYLTPELIPQVRRSAQLQFAVYGVLLVASLIHGNGFLLWSWLLPLVVGQPFLRFWLLAEHTGCSYGPDGTTNTRTTRTHPLLVWQLWNMPFHAEHHLYASLPFHALPAAHRWIAPELQHLDQGYLRVHRALLRNLPALAVPQ